MVMEFNSWVAEAMRRFETMQSKEPKKTLKIFRLYDNKSA